MIMKKELEMHTLKLKKKIEQNEPPNYRLVAKEYGVKTTTFFDRVKKGLIVHGKVFTAKC